MGDDIRHAEFSWRTSECGVDGRSLRTLVIARTKLVISVDISYLPDAFLTTLDYITRSYVLPGCPGAVSTACHGPHLCTCRCRQLAGRLMRTRCRVPGIKSPVTQSASYVTLNNSWALSEAPLFYFQQRVLFRLLANGRETSWRLVCTHRRLVLLIPLLSF